MISRRGFAAAAALLAAAPAHAAEQRVEAPFRLTFGRAWTSVWINGEGPFRFIIDTGAAIFSVKASLAPRLGLVAGRDDLMNTGVAGARTGGVYSARTVDLAHAALLSNIQFTVIQDFDPFFDGLIPGGLFALGAVGLDWDRQVLVIDRSGAAPKDGYARTPLSRVALHDRHQLLVDGALDGLPMKLLLDTGASGVVVTAEAVKRFGLWARYKDFRATQGAGIAGRFASRTGHAESVKVGALTFKDPIVTLIDPGAFSMNEGYDALIGLDLLRRMDWTVVGEADALYVRPNKATDEPFRQYASGLTLAPGQPAKVAAIAPNSPAARSALKVGDVVVTKDALDRRALEWLLTGAKGTVVAFEATRDGGAPFPVSLTLAQAL